MSMASPNDKDQRVHLEEETAKLMHAGDDIISASHSLLDFNRSGIPLYRDRI